MLLSTIEIRVTVPDGKGDAYYDRVADEHVDDMEAWWDMILGRVKDEFKREYRRVHGLDVEIDID